MKKITLIIWFVVLFGLYVVYEKMTPSQTVALVPSNQNGANTASGAAPTTASSPSSAQPAQSGSQAAASTPAPASAATQARMYKDGTYTGGSANAYYGNVQVEAIIQGGKITNVKFLNYPQSHPVSVYINSQAMPYLTQEAVQAQNANVNIISGATFTSEAFVQSLASALTQAKNS